jgi:hypothetical protein
MSDLWYATESVQDKSPTAIEADATTSIRRSLRPWLNRLALLLTNASIVFFWTDLFLVPGTRMPVAMGGALLVAALHVPPYFVLRDGIRLATR